MRVMKAMNRKKEKGDNVNNIYIYINIIMVRKNV